MHSVGVIPIRLSGARGTQCELTLIGRSSNPRTASHGRVRSRQGIRLFRVNAQSEVHSDGTDLGGVSDRGNLSVSRSFDRLSVVMDVVVLDPAALKERAPAACNDRGPERGCYPWLLEFAATAVGIRRRGRGLLRNLVNRGFRCEHQA